MARLATTGRWDPCPSASAPRQNPKGKPVEASRADRIGRCQAGAGPPAQESAALNHHLSCLHHPADALGRMHGVAVVTNVADGVGLKGHDVGNLAGCYQPTSGYPELLGG